MSVLAGSGPSAPAVAGEHAVDVSEDDPRLGPHARALVLHAGALEVAADVDQDAVGLGLAVEARAAGAEHERGAAAARQREHRLHVGEVARDRHRLRDRAVGARVGGVADEVERPRGRPRPGRAPRSSSPRSGSGVPCGDPVGRAVGAAAGRGRSAGRRARCAVTTAARQRPLLQPHAGGDRHLRPGAGRPATAIASRSASVSSSRLGDLPRGHAVGLGDARPRRGPGGRARARPLACSSSANHLRIMYSSLRSTRKVTGTLVGGGRPQRRDPVLRGALAEHAHDRARGLGELDADGGGDPEAEAAAGAEVVAARASTGAGGCAARPCSRASRRPRCRPPARPRPARPSPPSR